MATVNGKKSEVAIIQATVGKKRGRKQGDLPLELIKKWASEGMDSKRIASRLNTEHGIEVSFRTIARVMKGER
jgi:hypothetical protein